MKKTGRIAKTLAVMLTLIMLLGLLPMAALAAGDDGEIAILLSYFNYDDGDGGFPIVRHEVTIAPGLSEDYGYNDAYYGTAVTALDAMVAAHIAVFGDDPADINDAFVVSGSGWITKFMGISGGNSLWVLNGEAAGASAAFVKLNPGDYVELISLSDSSGGDAYTWFELDDERVDKITVGAGTSFDLTLSGIDFFGWGTWGATSLKDYIDDYDEALEEATVVGMNYNDSEGSAVFDETILKEDTDEYGEVSVSFSAPGTYYLSAYGKTITDSPLIGPWLEVEVVSGTRAPEGERYTYNLPHEPQTPGEPSVTWDDALERALKYIAEVQAPEPGYGDEWEILALARGGYAVSDGYYEGYYRRATEKLTETGGILGTPTDYARLAIALTSIGADATDIGGFDLLAPLADLDAVEAQGLNAALFALIAFNANTDVYTGFNDEKAALVEYILGEASDGGGFDDPWGFGFDVDGTAMAIQALAPFKDDPAVAAAISDAFDALDLVQELGGGYESWGSVGVWSNAQVIVAAAALEIDPAVELCKDRSGYGTGNDNPLFSMLRFYMDTGASIGGFRSPYALDVIEPTSTQQGAYALVAYARYVNGDNALYDMRDCDISLNLPPPVTPTGITVTFKLVGADGAVWIDTKTYTFTTLPVTAFDLFDKALTDAGLEWEGAPGYISGIKSSSGAWLREFDKGPNSGWLYSVNGIQPSRGINTYSLSSGDAVVVFFTSDYVKEPGFSVNPSDDKGDEPKDGDDGEDQGSGGAGTDWLENWENPYTDIAKDAWYYEAVAFAQANGLMNGMGGGKFEPETLLTRAMLITILARSAGVDTTVGETWFSEAVAWGMENGITDGTNLGDNITREQLVTMLFRYAALLGADTSERADLSKYADFGDVSEWAQDAMAWAVAVGLVVGRSDAELVPGGNATRAEAAMLLMRFLTGFANA